jgi:hypothetical protein
MIGSALNSIQGRVQGQGQDGVKLRLSLKQALIEVEVYEKNESGVKSYSR